MVNSLYKDGEPVIVLRGGGHDMKTMNLVKIVEVGAIILLMVSIISNFGI